MKLKRAKRSRNKFIDDCNKHIENLYAASRRLDWIKSPLAQDERNAEEVHRLEEQIKSIEAAIYEFVKARAARTRHILNELPADKLQDELSRTEIQHIFATEDLLTLELHRLQRKELEVLKSGIRKQGLNHLLIEQESKEDLSSKETTNQLNKLEENLLKCAEAHAWSVYAAKFRNEILQLPEQLWLDLITLALTWEAERIRKEQHLKFEPGKSTAHLLEDIVHLTHQAINKRMLHVKNCFLDRFMKNNNLTKADIVKLVGVDSEKLAKFLVTHKYFNSKPKA